MTYVAFCSRQLQSFVVDNLLPMNVDVISFSTIKAYLGGNKKEGTTRSKKADRQEARIARI